MITETSAFLSATKQMLDLLKVITGARDQHIIEEAIGNIREKIIELQIANSELAGLYQAERQITVKLTEENAKIQMFSSQAAQYEIHTTEAGSTVYRLKTIEGSDISPHCLCAYCYQNRVISILQPGITTASKGGFFVHYCPACKSEFKMNKLPQAKKLKLAGSGPRFDGPGGWMR